MESSLDPSSILWAALALFVAAAIGVATKVIKALGDKLVAKIDDDGLRSKVTLAKDEIGTAADMVSQTLVAELKRGAQDGRLTEKERAEAMRRTVAEAKRRFAPEFWGQLMQDLGLPAQGVEGWIRAVAEAHLFRNKPPQDATPAAH